MSEGVDEPALEPARAIVDAHHHLYARPGLRYLADDFEADIRASGHAVRQTVFVQARSQLRPDGPEAMKPVGETQWACSVAARHTQPQLCAAIVGQADLTLGAAVREVLEAHVAAGGGRFRGIRHIAAWDRDASLLNPVYPTTEHLLDSPEFRAGFAQLAPMGLSFDAWLLYPQLPRLTALAHAFPQTQIVVNHCGGIVRTGRHAARADAAIHADWSAAMKELSACDNVSVKLGGLGMPLSGFAHGAAPPSSARLASVWRPWMEPCIEWFGARRCMFASNSPADRAGHAYGAGWNAMKRVAAQGSETEKSSLFSGTARRVYRLA